MFLFLAENLSSITVWMERRCSWNQASLENMYFSQGTPPQSCFSLVHELSFFARWIISWCNITMVSPIPPQVVQHRGALVCWGMCCLIPSEEVCVKTLTWGSPAKFVNESTQILCWYYFAVKQTFLLVNWTPINFLTTSLWKFRQWLCNPTSWLLLCTWQTPADINWKDGFVAKGCC